MNDKLENEKELSISALPKAITAMAIGRHFGVSANQANSIMSELGWIKKGPKGWLVTEPGKKLGGIQSEDKNSGASYARWPAAILGNRMLIAKMRETKGDLPEAGRDEDRPVDVETVTASELIDRLIANTPDWRGKTHTNLRKIIHDADPEIIEELKWMGAPVWSHAGIVCVGNVFKDRVQLIFVEGASLPDPAKVFNAGLGGNKRRMIDAYEGDKINEPALKALIRSAKDHNLAKAKPAKTPGVRKKA
jgi:hypothetical protein